jgi:PAT family beta-lactamase induction signal transducer AmpG
MTANFFQTLKLYRDRRLWVIFVLGFASGFPWVLIGSAMTAWLKEADLTRTAIGFFGSIFAVYSINFLWAPLLDRFRMPIFSKLGQRRSWLLFTQIFIFFGILALSQTNPANSLMWTSLIALTIALASATQDISIDAYRIETIKKEEVHLIPPASAMATSGWWTGYSLPGAFAFFYADMAGIGWSDVYIALSVVMAGLITFTFFIKEPESDRERLQNQIQAMYMDKLAGHTAPSIFVKITAWLATTVIEPLRDFFRRNGLKLALGLLVFIFFFKIGEAFLGRMSIVFYKEIGFTNSDIATYSKLIGWWVTIIFTIIGSFINVHFGIIRGLLIGGIAMAASNLIFAVIASVGPDTNLFAAAVIIDGFTGAFATVTFVSFITHLTSRTYTATQYALLASLGNFSRTVLSSSSGLLVDGLNGNWVLFFIITALMVIPSLMILIWFGKHFKNRVENKDANSS